MQNIRTRSVSGKKVNCIQATKTFRDEQVLIVNTLL